MEHILEARKTWHTRTRIENYYAYTSLSKDCFKEEFLLAKQSIWTNSSCLKGPQTHFCIGESFAHQCSHEALEGDPRSSVNLQKRMQRHLCRIAAIAEQTSPSYFSKTVKSGSRHEDFANITGLACQTNSSLSLLALDSLRDYHFAERLGVDLDKRRFKTAAVIVNQKVNWKYLVSFWFSEPFCCRWRHITLWRDQLMTKA